MPYWWYGNRLISIHKHDVSVYEDNYFVSRNYFIFNFSGKFSGRHWSKILSEKRVIRVFCLFVYAHVTFRVSNSKKGVHIFIYLFLLSKPWSQNLFIMQMIKTKRVIKELILTQCKTNNIGTKECYTSQCPNNYKHDITVR